MLGGSYLGGIALGQVGEVGTAPDFYPKLGWLEHGTLGLLDAETFGVLDQVTFGTIKEN
jgi:hypothetical protein